MSPEQTPVSAATPKERDYNFGIANPFTETRNRGTGQRLQQVETERSQTAALSAVPANESTRLSVSSCAAIWPRPAPSARSDRDLLASAQRLRKLKISDVRARNQQQDRHGGGAGRSSAGREVRVTLSAYETASTMKFAFVSEN